MKKAWTNTMTSIVDKKEMILWNYQNLVIYWFILCEEKRTLDDSLDSDAITWKWNREEYDIALMASIEKVKDLNSQHKCVKKIQ